MQSMWWILKAEQLALLNEKLLFLMDKMPTYIYRGVISYWNIKKSQSVLTE